MEHVDDAAAPSYEAGHKPKWLVVIDDTPECDRAVYFAARRAARVGAGVIMLRVIETHDRNQQWLGVADIMKAEAHEEATAALDKYATAPTASPASRRSGWCARARPRTRSWD
jgi:nucleotide-binding universal stress UspA family protein